MRYPASEKLGIIRLVEQSHLPVRRALEKLSMPRPTLYHWCGRYRTGWPEVLKDRRPQPGRVWSRTLTMALGSSGLDGMFGRSSAPFLGFPFADGRKDLDQRRVRCKDSSGQDPRRRCKDHLHLTSKLIGKWLHRELERPPPRVAQ